MGCIACCWAIEDGRIGVLYISDPIRAPGFDFMRSEPIFSMQFVAASLRGFGGWSMDDVHRAIRLYMPRTLEDTTSWFDVIVFDNANRDAMTISNIELLATAVRESQLGLLMTGGWESFGGTGSAEPPWGLTAIGRLLPTEDVENTWVMSGRLIIVEEDHEYISSIPWERKSPFMTSWHHNLVKVKPGGKLLAEVDRNRIPYTGEIHPLMVTWDLPEGARIFACTGGMSFVALEYSYGGVNYIPWEYYGDVTSNLMIYLAQRPVPQDVDLVHSARSKAFEIRTRSSLLLNLLEFIERFGANTRGVMRKVDEINFDIAGAREHYIELHFEEVLKVYQ
ncbi:MAG: hypothetical protein HXS50_02870, partial [Theionarchaea archaeon]|nr:hypothetical protein [Theionarchaea archaeon]